MLGGRERQLEHQLSASWRQTGRVLNAQPCRRYLKARAEQVKDDRGAACQLACKRFPGHRIASGASSLF